MHRLYLAPMAELSHRALRELIEESRRGEDPPPFSPCSTNMEKHEAPPVSPPPAPMALHEPVYFTEMISAPALLAGGPFEQWYLDGGPCPHRLVYQLVGAKTETLTKAAALLDRRECLGIDINMGCAAPAIARTGAGIRWMEDPDRAARLIEALRQTTAKQLSVKLRTGPKTAPPGTPPAAPPSAESTAQPGAGPESGESGLSGLPGFPYLLDFCRRLEEAGLDLITLHPRFGAEKFKRRARWDYVEALRKELTIPVVGNGDIASAAELAEKARTGPVMAGRLLVREPWAFAAAGCQTDAQDPAPPEDAKPDKEQTALRFLDLLARYQPPEFHLSRARRFFHYYCDNFTWAEWLRNQINRETSLAGIAGVICEYCRNQR